MIRCLFLCLLSTSIWKVALGDWPTFLGGQARVTANDYNPPTQWSPEQPMGWQVELPGHGQSSPVLVGKNIFVTAVDGPMKESNLVACYNLDSGKENWRQSFPSSLQVKNDTYTSRAAPTPVADANGVFAFFESGNLVALTPLGEIRWERDLIRDYGKYQGRFGLGGSLAQTEDKVIVLADNEGPSYLAAFDKKTGKTLWKTDRVSRTAWSSPMIATIDGAEQIIVSASGSVDGYSADSGEQLWTFDDVGGNTVASPVIVEGNRFLIGASPGRNGENTQNAKQSNLFMRVVKQEDGYEPEILWRNTQATSSFGSPVLHQGFAYYTNRAGVVYCIDAETGITAYTARLAESNWATPIGIGNRIYFFGKDGTTSVLQAGSEKKILAENRLWRSAADGGTGGFNGEIQYGVAPTPDGFIIRTGSRLFLVGES